MRFTILVIIIIVMAATLELGRRLDQIACDLPAVPCTTDSDCDDKNPHLAGCPGTY